MRRPTLPRWLLPTRVVALLLAAAFPSGTAPAGDADPAAHPQSEERRPADEEPVRVLEKSSGRRALDDTPGRWRPIRTHRFDPGLSDEQRAMIKQLEAIGYASGSREAAELNGVIAYQPDKSYNGLNFYTSGHAPEALLIDMAGDVLHRWHFDFWRAWPDYPVEPNHLMTEFWRRAYLYPNGDILAIHEGLGILKLDRDSSLKWAVANRAHHDLEVLPDGDIWVLGREARIVPRINADEPILEDLILLLDSEGREKKRISLIEAFEGTPHEAFVAERPQKAGDIFHTNTLTVLQGYAASADPAFRAGNLLVYLQRVGIEAVVDSRSRKVVWARKYQPRFRHDVKVLESGNLLAFENTTRRNPGRSRVVEYRSLSRIPEWTYSGRPGAALFSKTCSTAQRLGNGNTLITESDAGRALEVTPDGDVSWEFVNPHRAGPEDRFIATLFEVVRLPPDFPTDWIPGLEKQP